MDLHRAAAPGDPLDRPGDGKSHRHLGGFGAAHLAGGFLVPGTVVIFAEYSSATHEFRALADYRNAFWRTATPVAMTSEYTDQVAFVFD